MRITQGTFSFLPDLTDEQIEAQLRYALSNGWAIMVEHTDDPHPRNSLWEMWGQPLFDLAEDDAEIALREVRAAREACPRRRTSRSSATTARSGRQTTALAFIVGRPAFEPGLPARAPGEGRPPDPLHAARLRRRRSRRAALRRRRAATQAVAARPSRRRRCRGTTSRRCSRSSTASWSRWRRSSGGSARSRRCW